MEVQTIERKKFGGYLKSLIKGNGLLQKDIAKGLGVSEQYFSRVLLGHGTLTRPQFDKIMDCLRSYTDDDEMNRLIDLYMDCKDVGGLENKSNTFINPITEIFSTKFNRLTESQQIKIIAEMEKLENQNYDQMETNARNAGIIRDKRAKYGTSSGTNRMDGKSGKKIDG